MAFLRPKKRGKNVYWFYVKNQRNKKQKQIYLGTAETILKKLKKEK